MIKLEKINNERMIYNCCNSCHNHTDEFLYSLTVRYNNTGGQQITLCEECLKKLKQTIKITLNGVVENDSKEKSN